MYVRVSVYLYLYVFAEQNTHVEALKHISILGIISGDAKSTFFHKGIFPMGIFQARLHIRRSTITKKNLSLCIYVVDNFKK